jgi:hypothetical protein
VKCDIGVMVTQSLKTHMKEQWGRECIAPTHSQPRHYVRLVVSVTLRPLFIPGQRTTDTHRTGDWVAPRPGLNTEVREEILLPLQGIEPLSPGRPVRSQTMYWLNYPAHGVDVNIIFKCILKKWNIHRLYCMSWIHLAQGGYQWRKYTSLET